MIAVLITSGGMGLRFQTKSLDLKGNFNLEENLPKQFLKINGERILTKTINIFKEFADFLIVSIPAEYEAFFKKEYPEINYCIGGGTRQKSVFNALSQIKNADYVLITDAVRPFVSKELIQNVIHELRSGERGVIPAIPMHDTIKKIQNGYIVETLNREEIFSVQTPQGFDFEIIKNLHQKYKDENFSDDSLLFEMEKIPVKMILGEKSNIKITTPEDLK